MTNGTDNPDGQAALLSLYGIVFETLRHEGNGIWQRFNIVVGINLALFAGLGFVSFGNHRPESWRGFAIAISLGGVVIVAWSCLVLRRLWERHWHWRGRLEELQQLFPPEWARPIDHAQPVTVNLTEPYLWVLLVAWIALLTVLLVCPGAFAPF